METALRFIRLQLILAMLEDDAKLKKILRLYIDG